MVDPIYITRLEIDGFRAFEKADVDFAPPTAGGQWVVLLGNNGAGKSTLLRAIAIALGDKQVITRFLEDAKAGASHIRRNRKLGKVAIYTSRGSSSRHLRSGRTDRILRSRQQSSPGLFLVAYGSLRGTGSAPMMQRRPTDLLASLFIPQAPLLDPQVWLIQSRLSFYEDDAGRARYQKIVDCVCGLLPDVRDLDVRSTEIEVVFERGGRAPFASLSDGYLTTAAWVLDMIAGWMDANPEAAEDPRPISEQMTGIALVDEIDLHLHPIWQRQVIQQVRCAFPNMTFIVTTHSPLTIMDVRPGELFVIDCEMPGAGSTIAQVNIRPGDVDDILTGAWFRLNSTLDSDTEGLMSRHRDLLAMVGPDSEEVKSLERVLRRRLDGFGGSSIDGIVQSVANQLVSDDLRNVDSVEREKARETLLRLVREGKSL